MTFERLLLNAPLPVINSEFIFRISLKIKSLMDWEWCKIFTFKTAAQFNILILINYGLVLESALSSYINSNGQFCVSDVYVIRPQCLCFLGFINKSTFPLLIFKK